MTPQQRVLLPAFALGIAMILWASSFIAMKVAVDGFPPMVVVFGRMAVASILFGLLWRNFRHLRFQRRDIRMLIIMALCEPCLYFVFEAYALKYTSATQAGMIVSTMPLFVAVLASFILNERLSRKAWSGFIIALSGVMWLTISGESTDNAPNPLLGNFLETLAMIAATGYVICAKRLSAHYPPLFITAMQSWVGALFFLPLTLLPGTEWPQTFPLIPALSIVYLGAVITMGAYGLYNYGVSKLPAGQASAWINLIPVLTLIMGHFMLGDKLTPPQYAASGVVLIGVYLSQSRTKEREEKPAEATL